MAARRSFQNILAKRTEVLFVGRQHELSYFRENLALPVDDTRKKFVLVVSGYAGVGKSTLLHAFERQARDAGARTVYINVVDVIPGSALTAMEIIVKSLEKEGFVFNSYREKKRRFAELMQEIEADPVAPSAIPDVLRQKFAAIMDISALLGGSEELVLEEKSINVDWLTYLRNRLANEAEIQLLLDPVQILSTCFVEGLREAKGLICPPKNCTRTSVTI